MGNNKSVHNGRGKPSEGSNHILWSAPNWRYYITDRRPTKKMETKLIGIIICDLLGVTGLVSGLIGKIDSASHAIVFIIAALYMVARAVMMCAKTYFYIIEKRRELRK